MKIIKPSAVLLPPIPDTTEMEILKRIEQIGRICYKSEDRITEDSCVKFVEGLIKRCHEAVLEHASLIYQVDGPTVHEFKVLLDCVSEESGFECFLRFTKDDRFIISGNIRAWRDTLKAFRMYGVYLPWFTQHIVQRYPRLFPEFSNASYLFRPSATKSFAVQLHSSELKTPLEKLVHCDRTVIYTCDRGVSHEIVRHRPASYCQESTRYCNYSGDKFGNEITVIEPCFWPSGSDGRGVWRSAMRMSEDHYFSLIQSGATPQETRAVLPNSLKTELAMTTNLKEWRHFHKLRVAPGAHPQMREVANMSLEQFQTEETDHFTDIKGA